MPVATLLIEGSVGEEVAEIQSLLAARGFDPGPADGIFGPRTTAAVLRFQTQQGLVADGVVGLLTRQALGVSNPTLKPLAVLTIVDLGFVAERDFGLTVAECSAPGAPARWGPVHDGHTATSLHFAGRAFDAGGSAKNMDAFAAWVDENCPTQMAELIHNPNGSIKNGIRRDAEFWGTATWNGHRNHVHAAI
jgi:peptidoglycan hydrolase-like protein with peptidoglycan-binding domain